MIKRLRYIRFALIVSFFTTSCTKDELTSDFFKDKDFIKSEISNSKVVSNYRYNNIGKIKEKEGTYFYSRYLYDNEDKLIKIETAADVSMLSSSLPIGKIELMTAENSTISSCRIFKYDGGDKLFEIENYFKEEDQFVFKSKNSLEFDNGNIVRVNLHNEIGDITQFHVYEYGNNGNVIKDKYYSYLLAESTQPKLISETSYKFDNKKNPFKIFNETGNPGLYTNSNNIIETNTIRHEETPGFDKNSTSKTAYEYNRNNYPVKVISENSEFEYKY